MAGYEQDKHPALFEAGGKKKPTTLRKPPKSVDEFPERLENYKQDKQFYLKLPRLQIVQEPLCKMKKAAADSRSFAPRWRSLVPNYSGEKIKVAEADWVIDHADLRCATYM